MTAPKILWYDDQECAAGPVQFNSDEVKYIRADLVTELVEALDAIIARWDTPLWKDAEPTGVCIGKGRAALKALEEK